VRARRTAQGGGTPLTAIKACLKVVGKQLETLSLYAEGLPNANTIKDIGRACPNLTSLDLCCGGKSGNGQFDDAFDDAIIETAKGLPHLSFLRVPPIVSFGSFLQPAYQWERFKNGSYFRDAEMEAEMLSEPVDTTKYQFSPGTEDQPMRHFKLSRLQAVLPSRCVVTNNGRLPGGHWIVGGWGTDKDDAAAGWHLWNANSYKQMGKGVLCKEPQEAMGDDGSTITDGLVNTFWLQCGDPEKLAESGITQRFYATFEEWRAANPTPKAEELRPLGPVIHT